MFTSSSHVLLYDDSLTRVRFRPIITNLNFDVLLASSYFTYNNSLYFLDRRSQW